jgi:predicted RNA-binding protein YlqC (UPF0109 family)
MKDFIASTIKALADHPGDVRVSEVSGEKLSIFELTCHQEDLGRVIGKNGNTIAAVRALVSVLAARQGRRAVLEVVE